MADQEFKHRFISQGRVYECAEFEHWEPYSYTLLDAKRVDLKADSDTIPRVTIMPGIIIEQIELNEQSDRQFSDGLEVLEAIQ